MTCDLKSKIIAGNPTADIVIVNNIKFYSKGYFINSITVNNTSANSITVNNVMVNNSRQIVLQQIINCVRIK